MKHDLVDWKQHEIDVLESIRYIGVLRTHHAARLKNWQAKTKAFPLLIWQRCQLHKIPSGFNNGVWGFWTSISLLSTGTCTLMDLWLQDCPSSLSQYGSWTSAVWFPIIQTPTNSIVTHLSNPSSVNPMTFLWGGLRSRSETLSRIRMRGAPDMTEEWTLWSCLTCAVLMGLFWTKSGLTR